ncbi:MAG TPA: hypothetical protein VGD99_07005 [Anaerolineae bacterium]|jgi:hypothetical protein
MNAPSSHSDEDAPRDAAYWAKTVATLTVSGMPAEAINLNVEGRHLTGPLQGFGQLWQKTYRVRLSGVEVSPAQVVEVWKANLPKFMPADCRFYPSLTGVQPGEIVLIDADLPGLPPGMPVATGVLVLYADDESFTVMTPEGHPEAGFNTFSAYEEDGVTVAQIQSLGRANDPIFEFGLRFMGGSAQQEKIWCHVLTALAAHFGIGGQVQMHKSCVDAQLQWSEAKNIWHNAIVRTALYMPVYLLRKLFRR